MKTSFAAWRLFCALVILGQSVTGVAARATTKGLNQIVTPDIQPKGQFSISVQKQDPNVGNRLELQGELGLTNNFEVAVFDATSPAVQVFNAEYGLYDKGPLLLSTGFLGWTTNGIAPQPFLEGGYYFKNLQLILGAERGPSQNAGDGSKPYNVYGTQAVTGIAYSPSSHLKLQVDYQSQDSNFATAGFTYAVTGSLSFNPAIYVTNSTPRKGYGYAVLTWTVTAF